MYIFSARVFGNFHFLPCYLPLFPFDLFGLNLEFEPTTRREIFLTKVTDALFLVEFGFSVCLILNYPLHMRVGNEEINGQPTWLQPILYPNKC